MIGRFGFRFGRLFSDPNRSRCPPVVVVVALAVVVVAVVVVAVAVTAVAVVVAVTVEPGVVQQRWPSFT